MCPEHIFLYTIHTSWNFKWAFFMPIVHRSVWKLFSWPEPKAILSVYDRCPQDWRSGGILFLSCLSFCNSVWNFSFTNNFSTIPVSARALIITMSILWDKTFLWVPIFFTLWPWPWSLTYFLENFNLAKTFEQLLYFTWVFFVTKLWVPTFVPCDLDLGVWPTFLKL